MKINIQPASGSARPEKITSLATAETADAIHGRKDLQTVEVLSLKLKKTQGPRPDRLLSKHALIPALSHMYMCTYIYIYIYIYTYIRMLDTSTHTDTHILSSILPESIWYGSRTSSVSATATSVAACPGLKSSQWCAGAPTSRHNSSNTEHPT